MSKKIALILCGSGYRDGSEIREAVASLWALSLHDIETHCFAPDAPQADVVDCYHNKQSNEQRNQLIEAARIARGQIRPLSELIAQDFHGLIMPGGFGAAKNLCSFATQGSKGSVLPELAKVLEDFHSQKKPIGAICIAPAIVALAFKNKSLELSVGAPSECSQEIEKLGHKHVVTRPHECHVDRENRIVTTPAYMYDQAPLKEIFEGIRRLAEAVIAF